MSRFDDYAFRESSPRKPEDECKTLSIVITKDDNPFCWVAYVNHRYRRNNLGLTQSQIYENEKLAHKEKVAALTIAKQICDMLTNGNIKPELIRDKAMSVKSILQSKWYISNEKKH